MFLFFFLFLLEVYMCGPGLCVFTGQKLSGHYFFDATYVLMSR